jgi:predicted dithiol-disulfide oxidoreductase (DUF899 family)
MSKSARRFRPVREDAEPRRAHEEIEMTNAQVVSPAEWLVARKDLLTKEIAAAEAREAVSAARRALPKVEIAKDYLFDGPDGKAGLVDLFDGRPQLIVYHFMFDPSWNEGCKHCSFLVDNVGHLAHLHARNTSFAIVSRAPLGKIEPFKARMGWTFPWYSSFGSDFNHDFHATLDRGERGGLSVFFREDDTVFHTYSAYEEGTELLHGTLNYLDLTPLGRQDGPGSPWLRHHDKYRA